MIFKKYLDIAFDVFEKLLQESDGKVESFEPERSQFDERVRRERDDLVRLSRVDVPCD